MPFTPLEIIALIFALITLLKIIFIIVNKQTWYKNVAKPIYENKKSA